MPQATDGTGSSEAPLSYKGSPTPATGGAGVGCGTSRATSLQSGSDPEQRRRWGAQTDIPVGYLSAPFLLGDIFTSTFLSSSSEPKKWKLVFTVTDRVKLERETLLRECVSASVCAHTRVCCAV